MSRPSSRRGSCHSSSEVLKTNNRKRNGSPSTSPVKLLESELLQLRGELRKTIRAYSARLEIQLAQSVAAVRASPAVDELPKERLHQLRDMATLVRKRKVKPEKGRRKDLRKIDALITDLHLFLPQDSKH